MHRHSIEPVLYTMNPWILPCFLLLIIILKEKCSEWLWESETATAAIISSKSIMDTIQRCFRMRGISLSENQFLK